MGSVKVSAEFGAKCEGGRIAFAVGDGVFEARSWSGAKLEGGLKELDLATSQDMRRGKRCAARVAMRPAPSMPRSNGTIAR